MSRSTSFRQLLIGFDSMEWDLVRKWTAAGKMPNFQRLMREGAQAELSTVADFPDVAWVCLSSGLNPAHLGRYFYVQHDPDIGGLRYMPDDSFGVNFFWNHLSDAGQRVGVVDVPHVSAGPTLNGFEIVAWGTHAAHGPRSSTPTALIREVDQRFGRHPVGDCDQVSDAPRSRRAMRTSILGGVRAHGELFRDCITEREWDTLMTVFSAPHCAGHLYWHDMDPSHPRHDPENRDQLADTIEEVYRAIDREVGEMIEAAGPGVRVYAFTAHGMEPLYHASWNLPEILDHLGYGREESHNVQRPGEMRPASVNFWRILRMVMPGKLQYAIRDALPRRLQNELLFRFYRGNRSWDGCRAFAVPNNESSGAIRINLKGRDHNGIVEPGAEYDRICEDLRVALAELTDPVSGRPVIEKISLIQRELHGPNLDRLPDITVRWDQSFPWCSIYSPRVGTLRLRDQDMRTGSHSSRAFMLAAGAGIPAGSVLSGASILDLAPTILSAAGVAIPAACEGRPLF